MLLSLLSGIDHEIGWALDRLCRLCDNDQFMLKATPGLTDALFEWPEWYVKEGYKVASEFHLFFSPDPSQTRKRRHALESLFVLRNAAFNEPNAVELAGHSRTKSLILAALHNLDSSSDECSEFMLYIIELMYAISSEFLLSTLSRQTQTNPLPPLQNIAYQSSNRSLIIASLTTLTSLFSNPSNTPYITSDSLSLQASIRYLPLFIDKPLVDACLNYFYVHISNPSMGKAFLLHPGMPGVLKLLVSLLLSEQSEETISIDVTGVVHTAPALTVTVRDHELTKEEFDDLLGKPEPQRCYEW